MAMSAALAAFAAAVLGASVFCSWSVAHGASPQWRLLFRLLCHGIESRSLVAFGVPLPICARCTAIYGGAIAGVVIAQWLPALRERGARIVVAIAFAPMGIDALTQLLTLRESSNALRIVTGLPAGIAAAIWCIAALREHASDRVHASFQSS